MIEPLRAVVAVAGRVSSDERARLAAHLGVAGHPIARLLRDPLHPGEDPDRGHVAAAREFFRL